MSVTADVAPTAAATSLDLLLRMWGGRNHAAEVCECLGCVRTDVLHDVSVVYEALRELLILMPCVSV